MSRKYTLVEIKEKANKVHNNKYDYSLIDSYENMHKIEKIICKKHGVFYQSMNEHINKQKGCKFCAVDERRDTTDIFIKKSKNVHGDFYDYKKTEYIDSKTKVIIICPKHGEFTQKPNDHINGKGCPICNESKGEKEIRKFLEINNIKYEREKQFKDCKDKRKLPFDFYLPDFNMCIEYDGEQHFKSFEFFGGDKKLKKIQKHDMIKNIFCKTHDIKLIRIRYDENIDFKKIKKINDFRQRSQH